MCTREDRSLESEMRDIGALCLYEMGAPVTDQELDAAMRGIFVLKKMGIPHVRKQKPSTKN